MKKTNSWGKKICVDWNEARVLYCRGLPWRNLQDFRNTSNSPKTYWSQNFTKFPGQISINALETYFLPRKLNSWYLYWAWKIERTGSGHPRQLGGERVKRKKVAFQFKYWLSFLCCILNQAVNTQPNCHNWVTFDRLSSSTISVETLILCLSSCLLVYFVSFCNQTVAEDIFSSLPLT